MKTVAAIIEDNDKILLIKRSNTSAFNGYWALPGGKVDNRENPRGAIVREVKEETNLNFEPKHFLGDYKEHFSQYGWDADVKVFLGEYSGELRGNEESSDMNWFSFNQIEKMELAFHHKKIVEDFYKYENNK